MQSVNVPNMMGKFMDWWRHYEQGKVLADYLTGKETKGYKGSTTFTSLKVSGCDLYSAGQIVEDEDVHGVEIFNSVDNIYKKCI